MASSYGWGAGLAGLLWLVGIVWLVVTGLAAWNTARNTERLARAVEKLLERRGDESH